MVGNINKFLSEGWVFKYDKALKAIELHHPERGQSKIIARFSSDFSNPEEFVQAVAAKYIEKNEEVQPKTDQALIEKVFKVSRDFQLRNNFPTYMIVGLLDQVIDMIKYSDEEDD